MVQDVGFGKKSNKTLCLWQEAFYAKEDIMIDSDVKISRPA
jgi:hypothetical protein